MSGGSNCNLILFRKVFGNQYLAKLISGYVKTRKDLDRDWEELLLADDVDVFGVDMNTYRQNEAIMAYDQIYSVTWMLRHFHFQLLIYKMKQGERLHGLTSLAEIKHPEVNSEMYSAVYQYVTRWGYPGVPKIEDLLYQSVYYSNVPAFETYWRLSGLDEDEELFWKVREHFSHRNVITNLLSYSQNSDMFCLLMEYQLITKVSLRPWQLLSIPIQRNRAPGMSSTLFSLMISILGDEAKFKDTPPVQFSILLDSPLFERVCQMVNYSENNVNPVISAVISDFPLLKSSLGRLKEFIKNILFLDSQLYGPLEVEIDINSYLLEADRLKLIGDFFHLILPNLRMKIENRSTTKHFLNYLMKTGNIEEIIKFSDHMFEENSNGSDCFNPSFNNDYDDNGLIYSREIHSESILSILFSKLFSLTFKYGEYRFLEFLSLDRRGTPNWHHKLFKYCRDRSKRMEFISFFGGIGFISPLSLLYSIGSLNDPELFEYTHKLYKHLISEPFPISSNNLELIEYFTRYPEDFTFVTKFSFGDIYLLKQLIEIDPTFLHEKSKRRDLTMAVFKACDIEMVNYLETLGYRYSKLRYIPSNCTKKLFLFLFKKNSLKIDPSANYFRKHYEVLKYCFFKQKILNQDISNDPHCKYIPKNILDSGILELTKNLNELYLQNSDYQGFFDFLNGIFKKIH